RLLVGDSKDSLVDGSRKNIRRQRCQGRRNGWQHWKIVPCHPHQLKGRAFARNLHPVVLQGLEVNLSFRKRSHDLKKTLGRNRPRTWVLHLCRAMATYPKLEIGSANPKNPLLRLNQ